MDSRCSQSQFEAFNHLEGIHFVHFLVDRVQSLEEVHQIGKVGLRELLRAHFGVQVLLQKVAPGEVLQSMERGKGKAEMSFQGAVASG